MICGGCQKPINDKSSDRGKLTVRLDFYGIPDQMSVQLCSSDCVPSAIRKYADAFDAQIKAGQN